MKFFPLEQIYIVDGNSFIKVTYCRQRPKEVTCTCRAELQERERLVYILGLSRVKTLSGPSADTRTG